MRHLLLTLLALCVGALSLNAQKLNYGVEVGYLSNRLAVDEYSSKSKNGFQIGGVVNYSLSNNVVFESGLSFVRKAGEVSGDKLLGTRISKIKYSEMDYLRIPITIGYKFKTKQFSICPAFGAYYAIGINGDSFMSGTDDFEQPYESHISTFSNKYGMSYRPCNRNDVGLTYSISTGYRHFGLKAGYDMGLTTASYYGNGKQRSLCVSVAYWIK